VTWDFHVAPPEIMTSLLATKMYLKRHGLHRPYCILEHASDLLEEKNNSSYEMTDDPLVPYDSVVVGLAPNVTDYQHLNTAFRILHANAAIPLIATHRAPYIRDVDQHLSLGPGPFVTALECATERHYHGETQPYLFP
jgi:ribonucleotide monophosphatase NagD (HAD superfamily)